MQNIWDNNELVQILKGGGVAVMPTDTIYGIVGRAEDRAVVERIYKIRKRSEAKPCIVLISDLSDLNKFELFLSREQEDKIKEYDDRPTSFVIDSNVEKFRYLDKGTNTFAFRLPKEEGLRNLIKQTGPLLAPSANISGEPSSQNIKQAQDYFGDLVDIYIDGGELNSNASRIIRLFNDGRVDIIRE